MNDETPDPNQNPANTRTTPGDLEDEGVGHNREKREEQRRQQERDARNPREQYGQ